MSEKKYTIIEDWMGQLGLTSTELLIYATIYGFTQKEDGKFTAHLSFFKERFGICRTTAIMALNHLVELNLIEKGAANYGGRYSSCNIYTAKLPENLPEASTNCTPTGTESEPQPFKNCTPTGTESEPLSFKNCTPITYKLNKENKEEENKEENIYISPNGERESDIVESENGDECYCESDNSQIELSFGYDIADNTVNNADTADTAENKNSAGSKKETGAKSKKADEAGLDFREQPPSRELGCQKNNKNRTQINAKFEKFWAAYPRHIDKAKALKAFTKINPSDELLEQMLNTINEAKKTRQWETPQYIPYPTTWLNGSRWEDEIDPKDIDYDIARPHSLDNPIDRAVLNGENPFEDEDFWGQG